MHAYPCSCRYDIDSLEAINIKEDAEGLKESQRCVCLTLIVEQALTCFLINVFLIN